jgi:protein O-mannosyl-transferase
VSGAAGNARPTSLRRDLGIAAIVATIAFVVFLPGLSCGFVALDAPQSVARYAPILRGLTAEGWRLAWTEQYFGHWVPITLLTVMLDWELWGDWAAGHHLTNHLLHAANAALVFLLLQRLTGAPWRSAAVALLFAVHPLRVEPVLWLTGRKDLLSAFWSLVALLMYAHWHDVPSRLRRSGVVAALALALLAKATAVVVPVLMLLLDAWPLGRLRSPVGRASRRGREVLGRCVAMLREKMLLFALAAAASVAAIVSARAAGAMAPLEQITLAERLTTAAVVAGRFLAQTFWPRGLAAYYPLPSGGFPAAAVAAAIAALIVVTAAVVLGARRAPWLPVGWSWWLVCILPVTGLAQAGEQAGADRYTYLASVGLLVAIVWTVAELTRWPSLRLVRVALLAGATAACVLMTWRLIPSWRDTGTLYARAAAVTENNYFAHVNLGSWYLHRGDMDTALGHLRMAVEQGPRVPLAWVNLGSALRREGDREGAREALVKAILIDPDHLAAHVQLAALLEEEGKLGPAVGHLAVAVTLDPRDPAGWNGLNDLLTRPGGAREGLPYLQAVADERPAPHLAQLLEVVRRAVESAGPAVEGEHGEGARPGPDPPASAPGPRAPGPR